MSDESIPIGVFSTITQLTPKALRLYDEKQILNPTKDPFTGYRYYTFDQIGIGIKIKLLVTMGFNLAEIANILDMAHSGVTDDLDQVFSKRLQEIRIEIQRLRKIEQIIQSENPMELLSMRCTTPAIKELPRTRVISRRGIGSYGQTIGRLIGELVGELSQSDAQMTGPIMFISHDDEYKEQDAKIEVAIPIKGRIQASEETEVKYLDDTKVVSLIYTGPYSEVGIGYSKGLEFVKANSLKIVGKTRELYLNSPEQVDEDQLMTEIQIPVEGQ